jgi:hypothetical protein
MRKLFQPLILMAVMTGGSLVARAQEGPPPMPQGPPQGGQGMRFQIPNFADLDKNKDKKISREEYQGPSQFFDRLDENKDGFIDEEEYARMRQRMERGGPGGGPNLGERFSRFMDGDKNGKVTREEFAWDGEALRFSSLMPSTGHRVSHVFRLSPGKRTIEHEYTLLEIWKRKEST